MKILILFFLINFNFLLTQEYVDEPYSPRNSLGLFGGVGLNFHAANFQTLPGIDGCCDEYNVGSGLGYNFGLFYDMPVSTKIDLDIRLIYAEMGANLLKARVQKVQDANYQEVDNAEVEFSIDSKLTTFGLEPLLAWKVSDQLRIKAGVRVAYLLSNNAIQSEKVLTPSYGVLIDKDGNQRREINKYDGEIPEIGSIDISIVGAISYDLPLNKNFTWFLVPEARYSLGLMSYHPDDLWQSNQLTGGLGIRYAPRKLKPVTPPPPAPPPPPPPPLPMPPPAEPELEANIIAMSVDENGNESSVATIKVEEFVQNKTHPLLNFVFFDNNSDQIPLRYTRITESEKENFSFKQFFSQTTMEVYHNILNIVGKRMAFYPQAELTLIGCNSNTGDEKNNTDLSKRRAESVKKYLIDNWNIRPDRIKVEARNLPSVASNPTAEDGIEENRRVEIETNIPLLFEPMIVLDTLRNTSVPNLRFKPNVKTPIGIKSWKLSASQNNKTIKTFTGKNDLPKVIDWDFVGEENQKYIPNSELPIQYNLEITDNDGKVWASDMQSLPMRQMTIQNKIWENVEDYEIDEFLMIGFGYNKSDLNEGNKLIADRAKLRVRDYSENDIKGYSDRMGNDDYNKRLSERRALEVADYLEINKKFVKGIGEEILLYNNDLPEGRYYSRVVKIVIKTPI
jgi:outer membrane protein OmpA-like peptidoglycan-associated protein